MNPSDSQVARLERIDARTESLVRDVHEVREDLKVMRTEHRNDFVLRAEFDPIRKLVNGLVWLVLSSVVVAIIALVVTRPA